MRHGLSALARHGVGVALAAIGAQSGGVFELLRPVAIRTRTANRIELEVELGRPGILVLNEPFFPGWSAFDGEKKIPLLRANVMFRALALHAGHHRVSLEFAPRSWQVGWWVSIAAAIAGLVLLLMAVAKRGRREIANAIVRTSSVRRDGTP